jgi:hypothetical protein
MNLMSIPRFIGGHILVMIVVSYDVDTNSRILLAENDYETSPRYVKFH